MIVRSFALALLVAVCTLLSWGQSSPQHSALQPKEEPLIPSKHSGPPVVGEFQRDETESARDQVRRQMREERYSSGSPSARLPVTDPGGLVNGKSESADMIFIDYVALAGPDPHGIPASTSNAVVIATVLDGTCFISREHTHVYTDYRVRVDEILKQDDGARLTVGQQVVAARPGGAIHFPSGHVTKFYDVGHGLPAIGSQYVFFLWRSIPTFPEYEILFASGYELQNDHVFPLDDDNPEYENMRVPDFLDIVRKAIITSKNGGRS
jgi:hypothetical protein